MAYFPGGFGTADEVFEALTLVQTGKAVTVPIVLVDAPGSHYWARFDEFLKTQMQETGMIGAADVALYRVTDDVKEAVAEIETVLRGVPLPALRRAGAGHSGCAARCPPPR